MHVFPMENGAMKLLGTIYGGFNIFLSKTGKSKVLLLVFLVPFLFNACHLANHSLERHRHLNTLAPRSALTFVQMIHIEIYSF